MGNTNTNQIEKGEKGYGHLAEFYSHLDQKLKLTRADIKHKEESYDLSPDFPKVYNQHRNHTSTSISISSVIEYLLTKYDTDIPLDHVSSAFIYDLVRKSHDQLDYDIFTGLRETFELIQRYGIVEHYDGTIPKKTYLKGYFEYFKCVKDIDSFQTIISVLKLPILFGYNVHESFLNIHLWNNDGVMPLPTVNDKVKGIQTGIIVGYSTKRNAFIIRNSWGKRWKNDGYFYMPFEYIKTKNCDNFWVLNLDFNDKDEFVLSEDNNSMKIAEEQWEPNTSEPNDNDEEDKPKNESKLKKSVSFSDNVGIIKNTHKKSKNTQKKSKSVKKKKSKSVKKSSKIKSKSKSKKKSKNESDSSGSDSETENEQITIPLDECMIK